MKIPDTFAEFESTTATFVHFLSPRIVLAYAMNSWNLFFSATLGALVGLSASLATTYFTSRITRRAERKASCSAIRGEIGALLTIFESRDLVGQLREGLEDAKNGADPGQLVFPQSTGYSQVFHANLGNLGLLPADTVEEVVVFFTLASALISGISEEPYPRDSQESESLYTRQLRSVTDLIKLGERLKAHLSMV